MGLSPLRAEVRLAKSGPFRTFAYFAATGDPVRVTLDDCTWNSSQAQLTAASPLPRRSAPSAAARPGQSSVPLPANAQWGGARRSSPQQPMQQSQQPPSSSRRQPAWSQPGPESPVLGHLSGAPQSSEPFPSLPTPAYPRSQFSPGTPAAPAPARRRGRRGSATQPSPPFSQSPGLQPRSW